MATEHVAMESFIEFMRTADSPSGKTKTWQVRPKDTFDEPLGFVRWFGRWRCYSFYPVSGTVFERKCLRDIADFCERETRIHRARQADGD